MLSEVSSPTVTLRQGSENCNQIGNLTKDISEGIAKIEWTVYGKVKAVHKADGSTVHYRYDATGNRIAKLLQKPNVQGYTKQEYYFRDASGNVMEVYSTSLKNDTLKEEKEYPIYGSSRIGVYRQPVEYSVEYASYSTTSHRVLGLKNYELSNHLGNVLAVITDEKLWSDSLNGYIASVVSATDYEPFGLVLDGRSLKDGGYRYGFNGKEDDRDFGEGLVDFGARVYNSVIGRFASVDRLSGKFPYMSPFIIASNSPIMAIDVNGDSTLFLNSKGEVLYWQYDGLKNAVVIIDDNQIKAFVNDFKKKHCCRIKSPRSETSLFYDTEMEGLRAYGTAYDYEAVSKFFDFSIKSQKRTKSTDYFLDDKGQKAASIYNEAAIAMVVKEGILTTDSYSSKDMSRILFGGPLAVFNIDKLNNKPGAKSYLHIYVNIYLYSFYIYEKCNSCDYHSGKTLYHRGEGFNVPGPSTFDMDHTKLSEYRHIEADSKNIYLYFGGKFTYDKVGYSDPINGGWKQGEEAYSTIYPTITIPKAGSFRELMNKLPKK